MSHDGYFARWQAALVAQGVAVPSLLVDLDRVDLNVAQVKGRWPKGHALRLGVKSLPCLALLAHLARGFGTERFMVFHVGHVGPVLEHFPQAELLFGKPMPLPAVQQTVASLRAKGFDGWQRVLWLVDDVARVKELAAWAATLPFALHVALEVDIGLHRGGFHSTSDMHAAVAAMGPLKLRGVMGYDGHFGRLPWPVQRPLASHQASMATYRDLLAALPLEGEPRLNAGGSLSFSSYGEGDPTNELTIGSCLVKPKHFEHPSLEGLAPAFFIGAPVLKRIERFEPPEVGWARPLLGWKKGVRGAGVFLFGGRFDATPVSPPGLVPNVALADSANQALFMLDQGSRLDRGDWAFFHPHESEAQLDRWSTCWLKSGDALREVPTLRL